MGRTYLQNIVTIVSVVMLLSACVKDKPAEPDTHVPVPSANGNVYVACEGSLGNGNSTLYLYNYITGTEHGNIYETSNTGSKLGDVLQSIIKIGDKLYLCVNNSDKIVVLNAADHKQVGIISVPKPRYILPITATKAYVSTLFSNKVYIINPQTMQVSGSFEMPYLNPEGMLFRNNKAYICNWDTACGNVYAVDVNTDKIVDTMPVMNRAPHAMTVDKDGNLWVLSGNVHKGKNSAFTIFNNNDDFVKSYHFPNKADVIKPVCNNAKDIIYFIEVDYNGGTVNNGIYRMSVTDNILPNTPFIPAQKYQYFWALGIEPQTDKIYVADPKGFIQKGTVNVYDVAGKQTNTFSAGIGPGNFYFD